jgi:hypothetical protein
MAVELKKIGWEDGTLVSNAKVEIDGTIYEVTPEQYSGNTPLSAENLKQMETNTENAINEIENKTTGITTYNLNDYINTSLVSLTRGTLKVKNGVAYVYAYLTVRSNISAYSAVAIFQNLPDELQINTTDNIPDFVFNASGSIGRGRVDTDKIYIRPDSTVSSNGIVTFNFSYILEEK